MLKNISSKGTFKRVFEVPFADYQNAIIECQKLNNKMLSNGQLQFLKYPYLTSLYWAYRRKEKIRAIQVQFYFDVKQPQLSLFQSAVK